MISEDRGRLSISSLELAAGMFLTLLAIAFHVMAATSAGGLWRDEANTLTVATLPRVADVWRNLGNDSFPILWMVSVRGLAAVFGPMNDHAFRDVGLTVGLGVTASLWLNARVFRHSVPLMSLALLGLNASMIQWGDSMRAYGIGILTILVACALIWRFVDVPSEARFVAAAIAAIVSVNTLFYNAVLILAFCAGGVAVCIRRRRWSYSAAVVLIGLLAAVSLIGYAPIVRGASAWNVLVRMPDYDFPWFWAKVGEALAASGPAALPVWSTVTLTAVVGSVIVIFLRRQFPLTEHQTDVVYFAGVSLLLGSVGIFVFLRVLSYYTAPWYYLALLALIAVCVDAISGAIVHKRTLRLARLALVVGVALVGLMPTRHSVRQRLTDVDIIADTLRARANATDLVVISPWLLGISFTRYYHGDAPWVSVPSLGSLALSKYGRLRSTMSLPDQTAPARFITDSISTVLRSGGQVFFAGMYPPIREGQVPIVLSPAPWKGEIWNEGAHEKQWDTMVQYFLRMHSSRNEVPIAVDRVVSPYERVTVDAYRGWKP